MSYMFKTCPDCGANLDPGERCDCKGPVTIVSAAKTTNLPSCDRLYIDFNFSMGEDETALVVSRKEGRGLRVLNTFFGEEAEQAYNYLVSKAGTIKI